MKGKWVADTAQRDAAWEMYVELITRISIQPLGPGEGLMREALQGRFTSISASSIGCGRHSGLLRWLHRSGGGRLEAEGLSNCLVVFDDDAAFLELTENGLASGDGLACSLRRYLKQSQEKDKQIALVVRPLWLRVR